MHAVSGVLDRKNVIMTSQVFFIRYMRFDTLDASNRIWIRFAHFNNRNSWK